MNKVYIAIFDDVDQTWSVAKRNNYDNPNSEEYYVSFLRGINFKEDALNIAHAMNETLV